MISGINIWTNQEVDALFTAADLAHVHPGWAGDVETLGPLIMSTATSTCGRHYAVEHADAETTVLIVQECASTMDLAAELTAQGILPEWGGVLAVRQTEGRGQLRRAWSSQPGNLHVSYLLPSLPSDSPWNRLLPLVLGWCVCQSFSRLGADLMLKWPNDLIQNQDGVLRKICGLLIEDRGRVVVAGTGVNLYHAPTDDDLRSHFLFPAGIIQFLSASSGPLGLWQTLVKFMKIEYESLLIQSNPLDFIARLSHRLLWMGEEVSLREGAGSRRGRLLGLSVDGGLRFLSGGEESTIYSGSLAR
ncbi:MAG: hypothetical protein KKB70_07615 [Proteobacteria bacterium]|nr:hypothetical protein [Pseudomonadota bacterium]MBU1611145.1 hypothetical protein [Pseudomonadota bacterium]